MQGSVFLDIEAKIVNSSTAISSLYFIPKKQLRKVFKNKQGVYHSIVYNSEYCYCSSQEN